MTAGSGARPAIGIDIGGTKILGVRLGDAADGVVEERQVPTPHRGDAVLQCIQEMVGHLTAAGEEPGSVGVGIPGLVDRAGILRFSPHLPGLVGLSVVDALQPAWPRTRFRVGNDATAAGWAEYRQGAAIGFDDVLMVTLGTGIGGGIISDGRLNEGAHHFAGEFGHMVVDPHGPRCPCGKQGCWERFASGSGLGLLGREAAMAGQAHRVRELAGGDAEAVRGEHVTVAAAEGDPDAIGILGRLAWWLALGLANLANITDPGVIVIGGGLIGAGELLLGPVRDAFVDLVEGDDVRGSVPIRAAVLGPRSGAVGAGLLGAESR